MSETLFKEGDIVVLKSGGPRMTVSHYDVGMVVCTWFVGTEQKHGTFNEATLFKPTGPKPSGYASAP